MLAFVCQPSRRHSGDSIACVLSEAPGMLMGMTVPYLLKCRCGGRRSCAVGGSKPVLKNQYLPGVLYAVTVVAAFVVRERRGGRVVQERGMFGCNEAHEYHFM